MGKPRIVLFDIESLPNLKEIMKILPGIGDYPGLTLKASINSVICVGWKVYGEIGVNCLNAWDWKSRWRKDVNDDFALVRASYEVLRDADVVVTHNGKRFDWKFLQTRILLHGFAPLPKILHVDTCAESKKHLLMFNNRLNTLAKFFGSIEKKENGGWPLWVKVSNRDPEAMQLMAEYCKQDVLSLEEIFKKLLPVISQLPNHNLFEEKDQFVCARCGSNHITRQGKYVTKTKIANRYKCQDCGSWSNDKNSI